MKKSMLLVLLLSPILLFPQEMSKENQEFKDIVMKYAYQYLSPMHVKVLEESYSGPERYFSINRETGERYRRIYDEISDKIVLGKIEVGVHESTHLFCGGGNRFIVSPTEYLDVQKTEVIRTSLIANDMINRNNLIQDLQLFNLYINLDYNQPQGSNTWGIYGLMDEYCAYYNGVSAAWILYKELKKEQELSSNDSILECYHMRAYSVGIAALGHMDVFYEFNSFIAAYLIYTQEHHPNIYDGIINNTEFLRAYAIVTNNYQKLAEDIQKEFPENRMHWYDKMTQKLEMNEGAGVNLDWKEVKSIYNDYIPFLEELRNIANKHLLTKK